MSSEPSAAPALWPLGIAAAAFGVGLFLWVRSPPGAGDAGAPPLSSAPPSAAAAGAAPTALDCPPEQLPDDAVCVPVPPPESDSTVPSTPIELLPGRTPDYTRYITPIANYRARAGAGALDLFVPAPRGVPVTAVNLESQSGPTRRWVTSSAPRRLLTLHHVERSGSTRTYVLAYDGVAFDTPPGLHEVAVGTPLGRVAAGAKLTGLTLRVRQLRRGIEPENTPPERLLVDSSSLACDPRNVLPLEPAP